VIKDEGDYIDQKFGLHLLGTPTLRIDCDFFEKYDIGKKMGTGTYGIVKKCTHKISGQQRAVKTVKKRKMGDKDKL